MASFWARVTFPRRLVPALYFRRNIQMVSIDPATQANYTDISSTHVHFDWDINWSKRVISGSATHTLLAHQPVDHVIFDSSYLTIDAVKIAGKSAQFDLKPPHPVLGSALVIPLASNWLPEISRGHDRIQHHGSRDRCRMARKGTYSARVRSVLPVLLSAIRVSPPSALIHGGKRVGEETVEYVYKQPVSIPSYLIAIASGNIVYRPFPAIPGKEWSTGVWTEPELMESSYWEFNEDTARYVEEAEKIVTPYEFGVYDLLLLPPSFPYGGMENACLTFITPTLLAGDRSLVDVVGHEISHSWFGNNVTTADSGHFWLNEGWTTWMERLLQQALHGPAERDFSYIIGRKALTEALKSYENNPKYQRLVIHYEFGEDPDDAYSSIPYEKGSNFLLYLERLLGGLDVFVPYVKDYVTTFRGKSIRTEQWKEHLYSYFRQNGGEEKIRLLDSVDWDAWFYGEGLQLPDPSKLAFNATDLKDFNSNQKVVFLERLSDIGGVSLPATHIHHLNATYNFNTSSNAEIRLRWYNLALTTPGATSYARDAAEWLVDPKGLKGRMKFCRPVFKKLFRVDPKLTTETWKLNSQFFHPIARRLIDKDLGIAEHRS
ncbi:hypothetical protein BS47DRAFT_1488071 [Hydnum rufescens UP504]|uniref:Peptidase M1 leukotriene A4 hydrolase/aminopeptidase C-terminal domain-containing protein n=1 Tax=Hydnum rufescens UP504 TaxID=1448309 RepID=A0A9P6DS70_9AGAM|nr:hypothetical protein BS47DRAFT_1488071 [Hydnum rufescens UP504]